MMKGAALSDWQRLQAKLLWDVVQLARQGVASLRACLVGALVGSQQQHTRDTDTRAPDTSVATGGNGFVGGGRLEVPNVAAGLPAVSEEEEEAAINRLCSTLSRDQ